MMQVRSNVAFAGVALAVATLVAPNASNADPMGAASGITILNVRPQLGEEAVAIDGRSTANDAVNVTFVSTFSQDLPDVVLSRTIVKANADGAFSAIISIAPGYTRGSVLTIYATSSARGAAAKAQYLPDAPNRGVVVPLDQVPRSVR